MKEDSAVDRVGKVGASTIGMQSQVYNEFADYGNELA